MKWKVHPSTMDYWRIKYIDCLLDASLQTTVRKGQGLNDWKSLEYITREQCAAHQNNNFIENYKLNKSID